VSVNARRKARRLCQIGEVIKAGPRAVPTRSLSGSKGEAMSHV
jgi:hypothetical protein